MFNLSWSTGHVPSAWREANVCPIYKGHGAPQNVPKSYRPISLTSCLVKVFERMVFARLVSFLDSHHFFSPFQAGFRSNYSTLDQLYRLIDRIQLAFRKQEYVSVVFLDIVAAFDCVWHEGLLYKLWKAGITGSAWNWIRSFLSDRSLRVVSGSSSSQHHPIGAGVPQGSILGPLLFIIYINDMPTTRGVCIALYADDLAAWPVSNGLDGDRALNTFLGLLDDWSRRWHLVFSMPKSGHLCFSRKRTRPDPAELFIGSERLPIVAQYRYLGVIFDPRLTFKPQANQVVSRAYHTGYRVASIITDSGPSPNIIRLLTQIVILPIITYGFPLWKPQKAAMSKLESAVCLPLRCALGLPRSTEKLAILTDFGIVGPRVQYERSLLSFGHRAHVKLAPPSSYNALLPYDRARAAPIHPTHKLFNLQLKMQLTTKVTVPLAHKVRTAEAFWYPISHLSDSCSSSSTLREPALQRQIEQLRWPIPKSRYSQLHLTPETALYIRRDSRPDAILRARIRLNRAHFNARQYKLQLSDSPLCAVCQVPETDHHALIQCPRFSSARFACQASMSSDAKILPPLSLEIMAGDYSRVSGTSASNIDVHEATATLLRAINRVRPI